jgi:vacuolar protein sorting-associated protein 54
MDDRLKSHAKNFDKLDWKKTPEGKEVHGYAETIVAETSTLHNVLKRYLSPMVVEMIMDGVFASYISRLTDEYNKIETTSPEVKETMMADAKHITDKLSQLQGVRKMDRGLIQTVEAREVSTTLAPEKLENGTKSAKDDVLFDAGEQEKGATKETEKENV